MSVWGILALIVVTVCVLVKWIFALMQSRTRRDMELEKIACQEIRHAWEALVQQRAILTQEEKQVASQIRTFKRNLSTRANVLVELEKRSQKEAEVEENQRELLKKK